MAYKSLFYMCLEGLRWNPTSFFVDGQVTASTSIFADEFLEDLLRTRSGLGETGPITLW